MNTAMLGDFQLNKTIWMLWMQGWDEAPYVAQKCKTSWEKNNRSWTVVALCADNLARYIPDGTIPSGLSIQKQSDFIRLYLMNRYGGVWADATCLCLRPLDEWLDMSSGFWMYRGWRWNLQGERPIPNVTDGWSGACGWFMASLYGHTIPAKWLDTMHRLLDSEYGGEYFLIDYAFTICAQEDPMFLGEWERVPYADALVPGGPACLAGIEHEYSEKLLQEIYQESPNMIKLSYSDRGEKDNVNLVLKNLAV